MVPFIMFFYKILLSCNHFNVSTFTLHFKILLKNPATTHGVSLIIKITILKNYLKVHIL
jgi:hypothetical protein